MEGASVTISTITGYATDALTWLLESATSVFEFITSNPLAMLYVGIGLAFVGFAVVKRVVGR